MLITLKRSVALALLVASTPAIAATRFTASDVDRKSLPKGVVIRNDSRTITAYQFFGDVRKALVSLQATPLSFRPFGGAVYNSSARASTVPPHLAAIVQEAGARHGVDPRLIAAVARQESAFNPNAVSPVGAQGLMQLMPSTARYLGVTNSFDPRENVMAGTKYLKTLLKTFNGDLDLTLAAYNAGPGAVQKYRGIPPYKETRNYVARIRSSYEASLR